MSFILATQEAAIRRIMVQNHPEQTICKTQSQKKPITERGLVEWLKV
jgi:hypothetical protein